MSNLRLLSCGEGLTRPSSLANKFVLLCKCLLVLETHQEEDFFAAALLAVDLSSSFFLPLITTDYDYPLFSQVRGGDRDVEIEDDEHNNGNDSDSDGDDDEDTPYIADATVILANDPTSHRAGAGDEGTVVSAAAVPMEGEGEVRECRHGLGCRLLSSLFFVLSPGKMLV